MGFPSPLAMTLTPASGGYRLKQTGGGRSPGLRVFAWPCLPGRFGCDVESFPTSRSTRPVACSRLCSPFTVAGAATVSVPDGYASPCSLLHPIALARARNHTNGLLSAGCVKVYRDSVRHGNENVSDSFLVAAKQSQALGPESSLRPWCSKAVSENGSRLPVLFPTRAAPRSGPRAPRCRPCRTGSRYRPFRRRRPAPAL